MKARKLSSGIGTDFIYDVRLLIAWIGNVEIISVEKSVSASRGRLKVSQTYIEQRFRTCTDRIPDLFLTVNSLLRKPRIANGLRLCDGSEPLPERNPTNNDKE